jgi:hypothetical protein
MVLVEINDVIFLDKKLCFYKKNTEAWLFDSKKVELEADSTIQVPEMLTTTRSRTFCIPVSSLEHKD